MMPILVSLPMFRFNQPAARFQACSQTWQNREIRASRGFASCRDVVSGLEDVERFGSVNKSARCPWPEGHPPYLCCGAGRYRGRPRVAFCLSILHGKQQATRTQAQGAGNEVVTGTSPAFLLQLRVLDTLVTPPLFVRTGSTNRKGPREQTAITRAARCWFEGQKWQGDPDLDGRSLRHDALW
jgi:hypothetical protein